MSGAEAIHPAALPIEALLRECDVSRTRRGGPGGQHRNKVETAVVVRHRSTGATGQASERRSQDLNREAAVQRLRLQLALEVRCPISAGAAPSPLWQSRARGRKLTVSSEHADFPALLAEALDRLTATAWDAAKAAEALGVTATQLAKFLQQEPRAFEQLNLARQSRGLRTLR